MTPSIERVPSAIGPHHDVVKEVPSHQLIVQGPPVPTQDVEVLDQLSVEVIILWETSVLSVSHLAPRRSFCVGETQSATLACDYFVPAEELGAPHVPLVLAAADGPMLMIAPHAAGFVELSDGIWFGLDDLRSRARGNEGSAESSLEYPEYVQLPLALGTRARLAFGSFVFQVAGVRAGKPCARSFLPSTDREVPLYFGGSSLVVGAFASVLAFVVPALGYTGEQELNRDRLHLIQSYLGAAAERERRRETRPAANESAPDEGGSGQRAQGREGQMGKPTAPVNAGRYAIKRHERSSGTRPARSLLDEARNFGVIGLLRTSQAGDPNAPRSPFGRDEPLGRDDVSALGNMWGDDIHQSFGHGGLGLTGKEESSGGRGVGIGVGDIGNLFDHGAGLGEGPRFGPGARGRGRGHRTKAPRMRVGSTIVSGRLPPEVIQRIVRQNYGRFRLCYEQGLTRNPNLEGRVTTRFAIGRDGSVANVTNAGSDLPDSAVVACVVSAFYGLSFPAPEAGIVTVAYPILFSPG